MDFAIVANHRLKLKEELKKLWNMKVMVIQIVIGALGTVTKGLVQGLEDSEIKGRVDTIQTTTLLRSAKILRRLQDTCCHSSEKSSANTGVKNTQKR